MNTTALGGVLLTWLTATAVFGAGETLKYGDGKADGKKSFAGTGEMIRFTLPGTNDMVRAIKIFGSRYGEKKAPKTFWIALDFKAHRTRGVYVSYDTSTDGQYSKVGLPGGQIRDVGFGGDWMIQVKLTRK